MLHIIQHDLFEITYQLVPTAAERHSPSPKWKICKPKKANLDETTCVAVAENKNSYMVEQWKLEYVLRADRVQT